LKLFLRRQKYNVVKLPDVFNLTIYVNVQFSLTIPTPFHSQDIMKPSLLLTLLALALFAPLLSVQSADVAVCPVGDPPSDSHLLIAAAADGHDDSSASSSLFFQAFSRDIWGLTYMDYWRGVHHRRKGAQVVDVPLSSLFGSLIAAAVWLISLWRRPVAAPGSSAYSIFIRTLSGKTRCMDVLPSETFGSVKQRLQVCCFILFCVLLSCFPFRS
jgi:hypothetical protein